VTVSVGVASFPQHGASPEALLDVADKAMYRAKSLGRNQTCSASQL
jgi:diguanylate cyclase (GGDEF)-like protein